MKAILISIQSPHTCNILNGIKWWEIRKKFPKDYVGWVYIYVTKGGKQLVDCPQWVENELYHQLWYDKDIALLENSQMLLNGKVVARFWCDRVEEITTRQDRFKEFMFYETSLDMEDLCKQSCLDYNELDDYLYGEIGYAIHITNLEIFDEPKEISEFKVWGIDYPTGIIDPLHDCNVYYKKKLKPLTRAPQSYCFIEIE